MTVSLTAVAVCVTVNTPVTGPVSLPSVVPAILTVALSPSRMSMLSLAVPIVMPGSDCRDRIQRDDDRLGAFD